MNNFKNDSKYKKIKPLLMLSRVLEGIRMGLKSHETSGKYIPLDSVGNSCDFKQSRFKIYTGRRQPMREFGLMVVQNVRG